MTDTDEHVFRIDATLWTALLTCSCGWRTVQMTRKAAWAAGAYHIENVGASLSNQRTVRRHRSK